MQRKKTTDYHRDLFTSWSDISSIVSLWLQFIEQREKKSSEATILVILRHETLRGKCSLGPADIIFSLKYNEVRSAGRQTEGEKKAEKYRDMLGKKEQTTSTCSSSYPLTCLYYSISDAHECQMSEQTNIYMYSISHGCHLRTAQ